MSEQSKLPSPLLIRNEPGVITRNESWCIINGGYMYGPCDSPAEVVWCMVFEWELDRHLVG